MWAAVVLKTVVDKPRRYHSFTVSPHHCFSASPSSLSREDEGHAEPGEKIFFRLTWKFALPFFVPLEGSPPIIQRLSGTSPTLP
ncbi:MAG: hypothetical protein ACUVSC_03180 [Candidatus Fervidibacter sp.]|uniref:hypothetical protein n=1 Tax=Candidatus Fervidibacter sp. TaxID=3100871 RepID=UPI00404AB09D